VELSTAVRLGVGVADQLVDKRWSVVDVRLGV
jgi:hypothetical protein